MNFWYGMINSIKSATAVLIIAGGLIGIFAIVFFSIFKLKEKNSNLAIAASTILSCFLMIPIISAFNNLVDIKIEGTSITARKAEIRAQREEIKRLNAENRVKSLERDNLENKITMAKQSIEIEALNDNIKLLENAELSFQSFQKILEVALLQTNLKQTLVRKEPISEAAKGLGLRADYSQDEVLVVITHDLTAKFGVDLNEVKIEKLDGDTVVISGIHSKFIGSFPNGIETPVKEVRRVNYKQGMVNSIDIQNNARSVRSADEYASRYENEFQTKLTEGLELDFMNEAVIQLAQNFLKIMLAPLYKNIKFDENERPGALSLMSHLQNELKNNQNRKIELQDINVSLIIANERMEAEALEIKETIPE
jgi:hypothetical protein